METFLLLGTITRTSLQRGYRLVPPLLVPSNIMPLVPITLVDPGQRIWHQADEFPQKAAVKSVAFSSPDSPQDIHGRFLWLFLLHGKGVDQVDRDDERNVPSLSQYMTDTISVLERTFHLLIQSYQGPQLYFFGTPFF
jgi:hypothetical protein